MFLDLSTVTYTAYARDLNHNRPDNETAKRRTLLGAALVVLFAVVMRLTFTGDVIDKAVQLAQAQLGKGYKYHVSAIHSESNWQTRRVSAA